MEVTLEKAHQTARREPAASGGGGPDTRDFQGCICANWLGELSNLKLKDALDSLHCKRMSRVPSVNVQDLYLEFPVLDDGDKEPVEESLQLP